MTSLFAICKPQGGDVAVKRVEVSQPVQSRLAGLFQQQANEFMGGVDEEIPFGGDYKPNSDEILYLDAPNAIALLQAAVDAPLELPAINDANFANEPIKGLFVGIGENAARRYFIQAFAAQQILTRHVLALVFQNQTFRELSEPAFSLDNKLVAIAENGRLKFKSFYFLKRIFVLEEVYREASDTQIENFCGHASLQVSDVEAIKASSNQVVRRLIHAVQASNVLDLRSVADIHEKAVNLGVAMSLTDGRITLPQEKQDLKQLLQFLDNAIYEGPLSAQRMIANSKRPFGSSGG